LLSGYVDYHIGRARPIDKSAVDAALVICEGCPVREPCGAYAMTAGITVDVFGGMTPEDRRAARDDRAA